MNGKSKTILIIATVVISMLLSVQPAIARDGRGGRRSASRSRPERSRSGRDHRGRRRTSRRHSRSSLGLSFGFSDNYYSTSSRQWVPGYFQTHTERILVEPGHYELQTQQVQIEPERYEIRQVPAVEETRYDDKGKAYKVVVQPARTETIRIPAKYEQRQIKVWVPDRYETRQVQLWIPGHWTYYPAYAPSRSWLRIGGTFRF
ncbi:MAG: hypothetical protein KAT11_03390 [Phycisphaerae bacterium]|nr:hypothetical protein [Phycisphaerae bacterium]